MRWASGAVDRWTLQTKQPGQRNWGKRQVFTSKEEQDKQLAAIRTANQWLRDQNRIKVRTSSYRADRKPGRGRPRKLSLRIETIERSVFIDGTPFVGKPEAVAQKIKEIFGRPDRPVSVSVVVPPDLPFSQENALCRSIVDTGATVKWQLRTETFDDILARRRQYTFLRPTVKPDKLWPVTEPSSMPSPSYYTDADREALRRAYSEDDDSKSVMS